MLKTIALMTCLSASGIGLMPTPTSAFPAHVGGSPPPIWIPSIPMGHPTFSISHPNLPSHIVVSPPTNIHPVPLVGHITQSHLTFVQPPHLPGVLSSDSLKHRYFVPTDAHRIFFGKHRHFFRTQFFYLPNDYVNQYACQSPHDRAVATGSAYWWRRYEECLAGNG
jgi:hypothetical protein